MSKKSVWTLDDCQEESREAKSFQQGGGYVNLHNAQTLFFPSNNYCAGSSTDATSTQVCVWALLQKEHQLKCAIRYSEHHE